MKAHKFIDTAKELLAAYLLIIIVGAGVFSYCEGKTLEDSIWWAMVTAMTVGYGDVVPSTMAGRAIGVLLMHAIPLLFIPLITARLSSKFIVDSNVFSSEEQEQIKGDLAEIKRHLKEGVHLR
jgi:voltage-gated potassium channel